MYTSAKPSKIRQTKLEFAKKKQHPSVWTEETKINFHFQMRFEALAESEQTI